MWEISILNQWSTFVYSLVLGCLLCFVYDLFKIDRLIFKRSIVFIFFEDILFWIISGFLVFSFLIIYTNGQVRVFVLVGALLGFFVYKITVSKFIMYVITPIKKLIKFISCNYNRAISKLSTHIDNIFKKLKKSIINVFINKKRKNSQII